MDYCSWKMGLPCGELTHLRSVLLVLKELHPVLWEQSEQSQPWKQAEIPPIFQVELLQFWPEIVASNFRSYK